MLKKILTGFLIVYLAGFAYLVTFQRHYLYHPNHSYVAPESLNLGIPFTELPVKTADGLDLKGWFMPAKPDKPTIVYFHGNADHLSSAAKVAPIYVAAGYGFLIVEYRGFSLMLGTPSEQGLYADARAFVQKLIADGIEPKDLILMGHSMGAGVATQMATEFPAKALILVAPFTSIPDMAQLQYPFFPARYAVQDRFDNEAKIPTLHLPILIVNGDKDTLVPPAQGQRLFDLAPEPKRFHSFAEEDHSSLLNPAFYNLSLQWLQTLP